MERRGGGGGEEGGWTQKGNVRIYTHTYICYKEIRFYFVAYLLPLSLSLSFSGELARNNIGSTKTKFGKSNGGGSSSSSFFFAFFYFQDQFCFSMKQKDVENNVE